MYGWVVHCFRNYAVFKGRAGRPEYWFYLFSLIVGVVIYYLTLGAPGLRNPLNLIWWLLTVIPSTAVSSRRLHDTGHSLWWLPAAYLPLTLMMVIGITRPPWLMSGVGKLIALVIFLTLLVLAIRVLFLMCRAGDSGPNRFGDPAPTTPAEAGKSV
jgi:uncharacterized membrane protein YhaH (DUF805 family)